MRVRRATGKILALLCGALSLVSCANAPKQDVPQIPNVDELRKLNVENAVEDARKALKSGDPRVLGVYGFAIDIPGAPTALREDPRSLRATYGIRMIEGTSDALISEEHARLNHNAIRYAENYNQTIFAESGRKLSAK